MYQGVRIYLKENAGYKASLVESPGKKEFNVGSLWILASYSPIRSIACQRCLITKDYWFL